ncbi:MAG: hypothetical protein CL853_03950 [Crocinitomicaceae bacterium]|nr:hypothetical protein [Crocinitomicaceae bacterium]|tara:strand:- start:146 stop:577 length:432 start_codon:yes stop_codon:yes gene_type:complete
MNALYVILGISSLALSVFFGIQIRKSGIEIKNDKLKMAGNLWLIMNGISIITSLIIIVPMLGLENPFKWKPTVCNCYELEKEAEKIAQDFDSLSGLKEYFMGDKIRKNLQEVMSKSSDCLDLAREIGIEVGKWEQAEDFKECN